MENTEKIEKIKEQLNKITTIKLSESTKERIDHLKVYKRESYDDILKKMLEVLNLCKASPEKARARLLMIDKEKKLNSSNYG